MFLNTHTTLDSFVVFTIYTLLLFVFLVQGLLSWGKGIAGWWLCSSLCTKLAGVQWFSRRLCLCAIARSLVLDSRVVH